MNTRPKISYCFSSDEDESSVHKKVVPPDFTKKLKIWLNKDHKCNRITINPEVLTDWESILNFITKSTNPVFGPIVKLVTLSTLTSPNCFDDLDVEQKYIALGPFCKLRNEPDLYRTKSEIDQDKGQPQKQIWTGDDDENTVKFLKIIRNHKPRDLIFVYVALNAKRKTPYKIYLRESELEYRNWACIRTYFACTMGISEGIQSVYTIFGHELYTPEEFENEGWYVAVPFKENFRAINYKKAFAKLKKQNSELTCSENPMGQSERDKLFHSVTNVPTNKDLKKKKLATYRQLMKSYKNGDMKPTNILEAAELFAENPLESEISRSFFPECFYRPEKIIPEWLPKTKNSRSKRIRDICKSIMRYEKKLEKFKAGQNQVDHINPETLVEKC